MAYVLHEDRLLGEPSEDGNLYTKIRECNGLTSNIIRVGMRLLIPQEQFIHRGVWRRLYSFFNANRWIFANGVILSHKEGHSN